MLDYLRIGIGDDEDRERGGETEEYGQVGVRPQIAKGFLRAVGRGGQGVGPQAYPREEGDQGDLVENVRIANVAGGSEDL